MRLDRGTVLFGLLAVLLAGVFVRLGLWQMDRLEEKRSLNALRTERTARPAVRLPPGLEPADSLPWRRVELDGRYDFGHEVVLRGRLRDGRPGVELLTPLRIRGARAVFVHRGWLPAADGLHAPLDSARTGPASGRVTVRGFILPGALESDPRNEGAVPSTSGAGAGEGGGDTGEAGPGTFRVSLAGREHLVLTRLDVRRAAEAVPYPVAPFYVRATEPVVDGPPFRPLPPLDIDEGPHLGYAIQWFAFASIAIVGAGIYIARDRGSGPAATRTREPPRGKVTRGDPP